MENSKKVLQKLKKHNYHELATPLLGIYPKKTTSLSRNDICTPRLTAALFTTAKTQYKQPICPSTDKWIKNTWHKHTMKYCSAIKNKEILSFANRSEDIMLNEVSQRKKTIVWSHSHMEAKTNKHRHKIQRTDWWLSEVVMRGSRWNERGESKGSNFQLKNK